MQRQETRRVLLVEDEPDLADILAMRLRADAGVSVETAEDGETALCKIFNGTPDGVLLDINLPGIDGWEVCRRLRADERGKNVPVIVMTAWAPEEAHKRAGELGVIRCFIKPFDETEFIAAVRALFGQNGAAAREGPRRKT